MKTLANLKVGEYARISRIEDHALTSRLMELNLLPGNSCQLLFKAPFGDPIALRVSGYVLSLRLSEARLIMVEG